MIFVKDPSKIYENARFEKLVNVQEFWFGITWTIIQNVKNSKEKR